MSALDDYLGGEVQKSRILRDDAIAEVAALRDSLSAWATLWAHICARLGAEEGIIANESNFDAMLATHVAEQARQLRELVTAVQQAVDSFDNDGWDVGAPITERKYGVMYALMCALNDFEAARIKPSGIGVR